MTKDIAYRKMKPGEEGRVFELVQAGFEEFVLPDRLSTSSWSPNRRDRSRE